MCAAPPGHRDGTLNGVPAQPGDFGKGPDAPTFLTEDPIKSPVPVKLDTAQDAYKKVAAGAGCSLHRDAVDTKLIAELTSLGTQGGIIKSESELVGFGELKSGPLPASTAKDGIPASWKTTHGLSLTDPKVATASGNNDGYTNLEAYLNELASGSVPNADLLRRPNNNGPNALKNGVLGGIYPLSNLYSLCFHCHSKNAYLSAIHACPLFPEGRATATP